MAEYYGNDQESRPGTAVAVPAGRPVGDYGRRGIELRSIADAWRFAECLFQSGLSPKGFTNAQAVLVAIQMGAEVGLPPMASIQNIAVIGNRPSIWGDAMLAVCRNCGVFDDAAFSEEIYEDKTNGLTARCTCRRLPNGKPVTQTFSVADAKLAGLWGKAGPWVQYPKRMLQMRARSFALRDAFGDALRGLLTVEEIRDNHEYRDTDMVATVETDRPEAIEGGTRDSIDEAGYLAEPPTPTPEPARTPRRASRKPAVVSDEEADTLLGGI